MSSKLTYRLSTTIRDDCYNVIGYNRFQVLFSSYSSDIFNLQQTIKQHLLKTCKEPYNDIE